MAGYTGSIADAGRLIHIAKRRERHKEDIEKQKQKIQAENMAQVQNIGSKFQAHYDAIEQQLKSSTVGKFLFEHACRKVENLIFSLCVAALTIMVGLGI
jgi:protein FAM50